MGRACNGQTPDDAFPNLPTLPQLPQMVKPNRWLEVEHGRVFRRRIRANGSFQVDKHIYYINTQRAKQRILVHLDGQQGCFRLTVDGAILPKTIPIKGLHPDQMVFQDYLKALQQEAMRIATYRHQVWMQSADIA